MFKFASSSLGLLAMAGLSGCTAAAAVTAPAPQLGVDLGAASPLGDARPGEGHETGPAQADAERPMHDGHQDAHATGRIEAVDADQRKLTISHEPIPEIGWPAMTMEFPVAPGGDVAGVKPGNRVRFTLEKGGNGMYRVESVQPAGEGR